MVATTSGLKWTRTIRRLPTVSKSSIAPRTRPEIRAEEKLAKEEKAKKKDEARLRGDVAEEKRGRGR